MPMNMLLIFIASVLTALTLNFQEKKHRVALGQAYAKSGLVPPEARPRLPRLESALNMAVGFSMVVWGGLCFFLWYWMRQDMLTGNLDAEQWNLVETIIQQIALFGGVLFASGWALLILGGRSLWWHIQLERRP